MSRYWQNVVSYFVLLQKCNALRYKLVITQNCNLVTVTHYYPTLSVLHGLAFVNEYSTSVCC